MVCEFRVYLGYLGFYLAAALGRHGAAEQTREEGGANRDAGDLLLLVAELAVAVDVRRLGLLRLGRGNLGLGFRDHI